MAALATGSSANKNRMPGVTYLAQVCSQLPGARALLAPERLSDELSLIGYIGPALSAFARACRQRESAAFWNEVARRIIETVLRGQQPKHKPTPIPPKISIDTS